MQFCIRLALTTRQKLVCLKFANLQLVHIVSSKLDSSNEPQPMKLQEKVEGVGSKDLKFGWLVIADTLLIFPYCIVVLEWLIFFLEGYFLCLLSLKSQLSRVTGYVREKKEKKSCLWQGRQSMSESYDCVTSCLMDTFIWSSFEGSILNCSLSSWRILNCLYHTFLCIQYCDRDKLKNTMAFESWG